MKKLIVTLMLITPLALFAQKGDFTVQGKVGNLNAPAKVYLNYRSATATVLDSVNIANGLFEFHGSVNEPTKATVILSYQGTGPRNRTNEAISIYLEKGIIEITSPDSLAKAKIVGPAINTDNEKLKLTLKPSATKMTDFMAAYYAMTKEQKEDKAIMADLEKKYTAINDEQQQATTSFIKANPNSLVSLDALKKLGGSMPDYTVVAPLFESFSANLKNTSAGIEYAAGLAKMKATAVGSMAPDFTQNDPEGKPIKLSSFRGKYLLVDFWASWCGPCRAENPNVVKAYAKYHEKGFEILGVSLDNDKGKENWLAAIQKDGLTWAQVSDLKYWNNEVAKLYGISSIPQNVLLDPTGKIVGKNLRGEALEKKLAEIFQK